MRFRGTVHCDSEDLGQLTTEHCWRYVELLIVVASGGRR